MNEESFSVSLGQHETAHADTQDTRHAGPPVQRREAATPATVTGARDLEKSDVRGGFQFTASAAATAAAATPADAADLRRAEHLGEKIADRGRAAGAEEANQ